MTGKRTATRSGASDSAPRWSRALRALREAAGVTRDGWAATLGYGRTTVQRWETGETAPDAAAEAAIVALCRERALFRRYEQGPLAGETVTPEWLGDVLAQARIAGSGQRATGNGEPGPGRVGFETRPHGSNLPHPLTSFVGREAERAEVVRLLEGTRLLTLTGPGGCGKTRLAMERAGGRTDGGSGVEGGLQTRPYGDGVWWVELAGVADGALVSSTVAAALGVREDAGRPVEETLIEFLGAQRVLLVLDNCEHLVDACAQLTGVLLRSCPGLTLLATSRRRLGITGETVYRVPPLGVEPRRESGGPDPDARRPTPHVGDAVALFAERARAVQPSFTLDDANLGTVARVCERLDGMPLAIELAAARLNVLSSEQIAARLDDRFRLLTTGSRIDAARHQTLRALVDWSYDLLEPADQRLFERLSVFAGGFGLEAAEAVCADPPPDPLPQGRGSLSGPFPGRSTEGSTRSQELGEVVRAGSPSLEGGGRGVGTLGAGAGVDVLDGLARLVDASMVSIEEAAGEVRYRLLETLRQYAAERLAARGETALLAERHRDHYLALAEEAEAGLRGPEQTRWLARLSADLDNIRAALSWCERDPAGPEAGLRLGRALWRFWQVQGLFAEGRGWLERRLADEGATSALVRARALNSAGTLAFGQGDHVAAEGHWTEGLTLARGTGDAETVARALANLGLIRSASGDAEGAEELLEEALEVYRTAGDDRGIARTLHDLGALAHRRGDLASARALYEDCLGRWRRLGDRVALAGTINNLGDVARQEGDLAAAGELFREALALRRELGDEQGTASSLHGLGETALRRGEAATAGTYFGEALEIAARVGIKRLMAETLEGLAAVAVARGAAADGARLLGAADALREAIAAPLARSEREQRGTLVAGVQTTLGETASSQAWRMGRATALEDAIALALAVAGISRAASRPPT